MSDRVITRQQRKATDGTGYRAEPYDSRFFALYSDSTGELVGVFVYLKCAAYVARRLAEMERAVGRAVHAAEEGAAA